MQMENKSLKAAFSSILLFGASVGCLASPEHSISFGLSMLSYSYLHEKIDENATVDLCPPYFGENPIVGQSCYRYAWRDLQTPPINYNIHYECTLGNHFGIGLCFGYELQKMNLDIDKYIYQGPNNNYPGEYKYKWSKYTKEKESGKLSRHIFFIMPEATFYYFKKEHVSMYGKLAAGVRFSKIKTENTDEEVGGIEFGNQHFSCQVSPLCFEFGNKGIRGFMEYGFGHQGLAQFGVKHTFKKKDAE